MTPRLAPVFAALLLAAATCPAREVWVAAEGDDGRGDGSAARPWASLTRALLADDGALTVHLGPGTFATTGTTALPPGLALIGSGRDATTVLAACTALGISRDDGFSLTTARPFAGLTITDLTLAGAPDDAAPRASRALVARDGTDLVLRRLRLHRYRDGGLRLERWKRLTVEDLVVERTTFNDYYAFLVDHYRALGTVPEGHGQVGTPGQTFAYSTAIEVADLEDASLRWLTVDTRERGGRALGTAKEWWARTKDAYNWEPAALVRVEIAHGTFLVDPWHGWSTDTGNHPPQMNLELWHAHADHVRLHHNRFTNNLSLTGDPYQRYGTPVAPYGTLAGGAPASTIELDHNLFDLIPTTQDYRYAVETYVPRLQFHHNVVFRGTYALAAWGQGDQTGTTIHHNVFYGQGNTTSLISNPRRTPGLRFINNTVVSVNRQDGALVNLSAGEAPDQVVANNLFLATVDQTRPVGFNVGTAANWSWRFADVGTPAGRGDPGLADLPATVPAQGTGFDGNRLRPGPGSPVIDRGISLPETVGSLGPPDLGAFEAGAPPWYTGPNHPPTVDAGPDFRGVVGQPLRLQGRVTDDGAPLGGTLAATWTAPAGAGAELADATRADTTLVCRQAGTWELRLAATDGDAVTEATVSVTIEPAADGGGGAGGSGGTASAPNGSGGGGSGCGLGTGLALLLLTLVRFSGRRGGG